jgi:hypothetical protein
MEQMFLYQKWVRKTVNKERAAWQGFMGPRTRVTGKSKESSGISLICIVWKLK